jgi:sec-independent protein translocase protein TatC
MGLLYFGACAVAYFNDRRRARRRPLYGDISDDEISPLDERDPVEAGDSAEGVTPVAAPQPLERRYDDMT